MKKGIIVTIIAVVAVCSSFGYKNEGYYYSLYLSSLHNFDAGLSGLLDSIYRKDLSSKQDREDLKKQIEKSRLQLKSIDIWLRYLEPIAYRRINGPLPVEWENEVFEKFEPPYKREGAGLSLAELYLDEKDISKDSVGAFIKHAVDAVKIFEADSVTGRLTADNFFLCNRLYLLNLSAIYTTGFECPDPVNIIPELRSMLTGVKEIYSAFNKTFPDRKLSAQYLDLYEKASVFANGQPGDFTKFDHFTFIKNYVNPLFAENQKLINLYQVISKSYNDYTLNNECYSIFNKSLFQAENTKGVYSLIENENLLGEIRQIGKLLFYDPVLSGNNKRSCASCHKPEQYYTDTAIQTALQFDGQQRLSRNAVSLVNSVFNHLIMVDGKHISLQAQAKDVITNAVEMNSNEKELLKKVMSCREYKEAFKKLLKFTPEEKKVSFEHIISAITFYYGDFSKYYSPFDDAMNDDKSLPVEARRGFNLFMGKAQCGTCHFIPHFNGIKPPYVGSEFEVLGVPADLAYKKLSPDKGRYNVNPAPETLHAFRTGTVRNAEYTKPYMHNGVFNTLNQVIDFYNAGGGIGKKLDVNNQTLSADSLKLNRSEINELVSFIHSLNEKINFESPPQQLPASSDKILNLRKVGGEY